MINYERELSRKVASQQSAEETKCEFAFASLPKTLKGQIVEMQSSTHDLKSVGNLDFLGHLPPASSFLLVEIDLSNSSPQIG
jgi:hypothetical protein